MSFIQEWIDDYKNLAKDNPKNFWFKNDPKVRIGWFPVKREGFLMISLLILLGIAFSVGLIAKYNLEFVALVLFIILVFVISKKSEPGTIRSLQSILPSYLKKKNPK